MCIGEKCREATDLYYSKWLGQDGILNCDWKGIEYIYSGQRNTVQYGYSDRFGLYALCQKDRIVISYGDRAENRLDVLKSEIHKTMSAEEVRKILEKIFRRKTCDSIKFVFEYMREIPSAARVLTEEDYRDYEDFWLKCNPGCKPVKFAVQPDCRPPVSYFSGDTTVNPGGLQHRNLRKNMGAARTCPCRKQGQDNP